MLTGTLSMVDLRIDGQCTTPAVVVELMMVGVRQGLMQISLLLTGILMVMDIWGLVAELEEADKEATGGACMGDTVHIGGGDATVSCAGIKVCTAGS